MNNYQVQQELNLLQKRFNKTQIKLETELNKNRPARRRSRMSEPADKLRMHKDKLKMHRERMAL